MLAHPEGVALEPASLGEALNSVQTRHTNAQNMQHQVCRRRNSQNASAAITMSPPTPTPTPMPMLAPVDRPLQTKAFLSPPLQPHRPKPHQGAAQHQHKRAQQTQLCPHRDGADDLRALGFDLADGDNGR
jgi:hypothetical protein